MANWILKTEPDCYTYADLEREGTTVWDGVVNNAALKHIRAMRPGDRALIYHTGAERCAVGLAEVASDPYSPPQGHAPKLVVVDVRALRPLASSVSLAALKDDPAFADSPLVRQGRLSVVPLSDEQWLRVMELAGEDALSHE